METESSLARWAAASGDEHSSCAVDPGAGDAFGLCIYIRMTAEGAEPASARSRRSTFAACRRSWDWSERCDGQAACA
jgi:hypothetical protein